jgi:hypothetical protein
VGSTSLLAVDSNNTAEKLNGATTVISGWAMLRFYLTVMMVPLGFGIAIFGGFYALNSFSESPIPDFYQRGLHADGKVTGIRSSRIAGSGGSYRYTADFEFYVDGHQYRGVFPTQFGHTEVGEILPVVYLPEDPSINMVSLAVTEEDLRRYESKKYEWLQMAAGLTGFLWAIFGLILIPMMWSDLRAWRKARRDKV